jgi:hypothetical protein
MENHMLKTNKTGQPVLPKPKTLSEKVWITFQTTRQKRNELTKIAEKLNLNLSKYFRKKADDLLEAAKYNRLPADITSTTDIVCLKCKGKINA